MKAKKTIISTMIALIGLCFTGLAFTLAWFIPATTNLPLNNAGGGVIAQYFDEDSGNGTDAQHPLIITRPVHLYNLTELYQRLPDFANSNYYFQVGKVLDNSGDLKVYNYNPDGSVGSGYGYSLNMNYYQDNKPFRPIGSEAKQFGGHFDGSGISIDNLHVDGAGVSDIGVFGYVKTGAEIHDLYLDNLSINVTGAISNAHTTGSNAHGTNAYVGYLAGHVEQAGSFENAYINQCTISGKSVLTKNRYGYFGECDDAADELQIFVDKAAQGEEEAWGGSFNSKTYTNLLYSLNHSKTGETTNTVSGDGGYVVKKTASATSDPNNNQVVYRLRDGSYIPLKFTDDTHTQAALGNTGYLVGSNVGTAANASPKISSYKMVNLQNALTNTRSTNMGDTYKANNIAYTDSKLEVMTYQNGWKRIKDSHNENNNSTNAAIISYTKTDLETFGFEKYSASRDALQEVLESSPFVHGIHFDNNAISTSSLITVPANTARVNGSKVTTTYQLPKGAIDFNLKEEGLINFFAGTYNSSQVNLNFFSLYQVTRNNNGNITALTQIKKIYHASSGTGYIYQTGNSKPSGAGDLAFDVETILHGNAPVINMMYYFEIPVNAGEYAMGVAGSTQGAYMIYLDLGANGSTEEAGVTDFGTIEYRSRPDTADRSLLLFRYTQQATDDLNITVEFNNDEYNITTVCPAAINLEIAQLSADYDYYLDGDPLTSGIRTHIYPI